MSEIDPRAFGHLEAQVKALSAIVEKQATAIESLDKSITAMNVTLSEARGGWRVMMMVGGAGASFGGVVSWALQNFRSWPGS